MVAIGPYYKYPCELTSFGAISFDGSGEEATTSDTAAVSIP